MKPSSRPLPPGRPPRARTEPPPARSSTRKIPTRLVQTVPSDHEDLLDRDLEPDPGLYSGFEVELEPPTPVRRRRRVLLGVLVGLGVAVLLLEGVAIVRSLGPDDSDGRSADRRVSPLVAPAALPATGVLVLSEVQPDGSIEVDQWIRSSDDIDELTVAAPATSGGDDALRVSDASLVAADGTVLADDLTAAARPRVIRLAAPTTLVRASYVLSGAVDRSGTVDGRLRTFAASLDLDSSALTGPTVLFVSAASGGEVGNLACANSRSQVALLRPCGAPDGSGWRVRLPSGSRGDRVTAQVDF